jgi:hypothetical protein
MSFGETPWVDRNLKSAWPRIARQVPESWLPRTKMAQKSAQSRHKKLVVEEFACGSYGCVMPTNEPGLVCKITSDISEARFIAAYLTLPKPEGGIVHYEKIFQLADQEHKKRPLFVLWREEAYDVGFMRNVIFSPWSLSVKESYDDYEIRSMKEGNRLLTKFLELAHTARDSLIGLYKRQMVALPSDTSREVRVEVYTKLLNSVWRAFDNAHHDADPRHYKGIPRVGIALRQCYGLAMEMANTYLVDQIGSALGEYLDAGVLLADVHLANIGKNADGQLIITDPGHAVAIHPRWSVWPEIERI